MTFCVNSLNFVLEESNAGFSVDAQQWTLFAERAGACTFFFGLGGAYTECSAFLVNRSGSCQRFSARGSVLLGSSWRRPFHRVWTEDSWFFRTGTVE